MILEPRFACDDAVRVIRNLRNDGTYPGQPTGALLVRRGSVGFVWHTADEADSGRRSLRFSRLSRLIRRPDRQAVAQRGD